LIGSLLIANDSPWMTIPERGVVRSREPLKSGGH